MLSATGSCPGKRSQMELSTTSPSGQSFLLFPGPGPRVGWRHHWKPLSNAGNGGESLGLLSKLLLLLRTAVQMRQKNCLASLPAINCSLFQVGKGNEARQMGAEKPLQRSREVTGHRKVPPGLRLKCSKPVRSLPLSLGLWSQGAPLAGRSSGVSTPWAQPR